MTPFFDPGPIEHPQIPIYLAGVNPYMARLAGEVAEGCTSTPSTRPSISANLHPAVAEGLHRAGRSRLDFTFRASTMVIVGTRARRSKNRSRR